MKPINVRLRFKPSAKDWGKLVHRGGRNYTIFVDTRASFGEIAGTIMHEVMHLVFYTFFTPDAIDDTREHAACERVDKAAQTGMRRYLEGK